MGIRQKMNENPAMTTGLTIGIIVLAIIAILFQALHKPAETRPQTQAYFSDDDGKTWFLDDIKKMPPFDHNGKQAFRAVIIKCGDSKPRVWRLESYDPDELKKIQDAQANGAPHAFAALASAMIVKAPGETDWAPFPKPGNDPAATTAYHQLMDPQCPDGNTPPHICTPDENVKP